MGEDPDSWNGTNAQEILCVSPSNLARSQRTGDQPAAVSPTESGPEQFCKEEYPNEKPEAAFFAAFFIFPAVFTVMQGA